MRSRKEIMKNVDNPKEDRELLMLEILLDIRDLIKRGQEDNIWD